jgi:hypothetical protein
MGRDVAVRVDILQSLNKSLFGIVDHCCFNMVPDTPTCKCGRKPVETALAQRRSAMTPMRMTIPPASSLTRPGSSNVFASSAIFGKRLLRRNDRVVFQHFEIVDTHTYPSQPEPAPSCAEWVVSAAA